MIISYNKNIIMRLSNTCNIPGSITRDKSWLQNQYKLRSLLIIALYKDFLNRSQKLLSSINEVNMNESHKELIGLLEKLNPVEMGVSNDPLEIKTSWGMKLREYLIDAEKVTEFTQEISNYYNLNKIQNKHNTVPTMLNEGLSTVRTRLKTKNTVLKGL